MDEYFPEITTICKDPLKGKASMQILKSCPFPSLILELGVIGVLAEIKKAVKKTVGRKKAQQLVETAKNSIGVGYGIVSVKLKLGLVNSGTMSPDMRPIRSGIEFTGLDLGIYKV